MIWITGILGVAYLICGFFIGVELCRDWFGDHILKPKSLGFYFSVWAVSPFAIAIFAIAYASGIAYAAGRNFCSMTAEAFNEGRQVIDNDEA